MRNRIVGINVRVTVTEKKKVTMLARKCGLSLSEYLRQRALGYEPGGHPPTEVFNVLDREQPIFTDPDGHVPHPDTFTRHLHKLYKKCGLPEEYHLHTLRHFYATYLLQEGTSKQVTASLLGHADTAFLERTYCHSQDVAKRQAANLMQDLLNNQNPCYVAFMKNKNRKAKKAG